MMNFENVDALWKSFCLFGRLLLQVNHGNNKPTKDIGR